MIVTTVLPAFSGLEPYSIAAATLAPAEIPQVQAPTLVFLGLEDQALHSDALNNTWDWIGRDLTLVTVPGAGHFVQQDAAALVTETMLWWLKMPD